MKSNRYWFVALVLIGFISSCQSSKTETAADLFKQADSLFTKNKTDEAFKVLAEVETRFKSDTTVMCEVWRVTAEAYAQYKNEFSKTIEYYDRIVNTYPNTPQAVASLFKKAYTYENGLNDNDRAKAAYEEFIKKYPNHELADDAQTMIDFLGKPADDLIEMLEKKAKQNEKKSTPAK